MIRPRLWPSPGLVLALTLSDASFSRKVGIKEIWNPPALWQAVGVSRRELSDQTVRYPCLKRWAWQPLLFKIKQKNEGITFGVNLLNLK